MSLINRETLYEKACDLEAQALSYVGKIANDDTKIEEWRIWSAILAERTAFKHDIFDVPEVKPEPKWIPVSERLPEANGRYLVTRGLNVCGDTIWNRAYLINYSDLMGLKPERIWWCGNVGKSDFERIDDVIAWMPLPEPYRGEGE